MRTQFEDFYVMSKGVYISTLLLLLSFLKTDNKSATKLSLNVSISLRSTNKQQA